MPPARRVAPVLLALAYVGAAALPCPPDAAPAPGQATRAQFAAHGAAHAARAGAGHSGSHALAPAREGLEPPCHADAVASLTAPCPCKCGERLPGTSSSQRLGPAVLDDEALPAAPFSLQAAAAPLPRVPVPPLQLPDPVPIAS